jgi:hypothetical protein
MSQTILTYPEERAPGARHPRHSADLPQSSASLHLQTLGHASIALYRKGEAPILLTDPWLVGSVYWRSWWLQHYPSADEIEWLSGAACVYVTHEHPDHFHMPSIRRLGSGPTYLFPALSERGYLDHMHAAGYRAEIIPALRWRRLAEDVSILSLPFWNDDSVLLIDTPDALILNLNDAKPLPTVVKALRQLADRVGKRRILLCSYSPASLVNSFLDESGVVSLKRPDEYVAYVCRVCDALGADLYIPFASQASFERTDSAWANQYRTSFADLQRSWTARAKLLAPYTTLDLVRFNAAAVAPAEYRPAESTRLAALTEERRVAEREATIESEDLARLAAKLSRWRFLLRWLFPRGFSFRLGGRSYFYNPRQKSLGEASAGAEGDFEISVPALTLQEALRNNHLSDLGITMMVRIRLLRRLDPRKVYGLFVLFQFDDYGHLRSPNAFLRWIGTGLRCSVPQRLPLPPR